MNEKKRVYEAEVMALPPLRMVLGEIPSPDPEKRRRPNQKTLEPSREMEGTVKRIIAHLQDEE